MLIWNFAAVLIGDPGSQTKNPRHLTSHLELAFPQLTCECATDNTESEVCLARNITKNSSQHLVLDGSEQAIEPKLGALSSIEPASRSACVQSCIELAVDSSRGRAFFLTDEEVMSKSFHCLMLLSCYWQITSPSVVNLDYLRRGTYAI